MVNANAYPFIEVEHLKDGGDAERKAMLDRFVGAWNAHDLDGIMASMADDCVFWSSSGAHSQGGVFEGREAVAEAFAAIFRSFLDAAYRKPDHPLCFPRLVGMDVRWNGRGWEDVAPAR